MCWNIDYFEEEREEDARQISEYKKKISEINYEIEKQLAKNNEIKKNNNIILKEIETLKTEAISLFKEKYNETIKFDIFYKAKITLSLNPIKDLENKLIELKSHRKKLFELKLLTRSLYI